jgi:hypothetical protein
MGNRIRKDILLRTVIAYRQSDFTALNANFWDEGKLSIVGLKSPMQQNV